VKDEYDLVILGWGAAAFSAAIKASEITSNQASIAMIGTRMGGTCVNAGCVPSKYLIGAAAEVYAKRHSFYPGVTPLTSQFDFEALMASLGETVEWERKTKYEDVIRNYGNVELVKGIASFEGRGAVSVISERGKQTINGHDVIIATGSSPKIPEVSGLREAGFLTSEDVWDLKEVPSSLAVIGDGPIAAELGQAFERLGSEVVVLMKHPWLVPRAEPELGMALTEALRSEGVKFEPSARVRAVKKTRNGKLVEFSAGEGEEKRAEVDEVLVAVGRSPNLPFGLEKAGVAYSDRGIKVDASMRTTSPRVYAAGDVVDQPLMLETLAAKEGAMIAENVYDHAGKELDLRAVPWSVFSDPQLASVGYKEAEYPGKAVSRLLPLESVPRARIMRRREGMFKLVVDAETDKVVGVHALTPIATEVIVEGVYALKYGLTVSDIVDATHVFPTLSEGIKLAAQSFTRDIEKMSCCVERRRSSNSSKVQASGGRCELLNRVSLPHGHDFLSGQQNREDWHRPFWTAAKLRFGIC